MTLVPFNLQLAASGSAGAPGLVSTLILTLITDTELNWFVAVALWSVLPCSLIVVW